MPPGSYYIGDLHMLTKDHGMYRSARSRIERQVLEAPGQLVADQYFEHLLVAVSFPMQPHFFRQYLVTNMGKEIEFVRHTPFEPRETGTLAVINLASLKPIIGEIAPDLPALFLLFDEDTIADFNGHRLRMGTVEIITQTTISKATQSQT